MLQPRHFGAGIVAKDGQNMLCGQIQDTAGHGFVVDGIRCIIEGWNLDQVGEMGLPGGSPTGVADWERINGAGWKRYAAYVTVNGEQPFNAISFIYHSRSQRNDAAFIKKCHSMALTRFSGTELRVRGEASYLITSAVVERTGTATSTPFMFNGTMVT